mmetsp:Transcript_23412/g.54047  ORF Transcript_23412/g.54047 Transcript_23412/m.54047 type:complete len:411 (-) Transcript_23412:42-1274(-)
MLPRINARGRRGHDGSVSSRRVFGVHSISEQLPSEDEGVHLPRFRKQVISAEGGNEDQNSVAQYRAERSTGGQQSLPTVLPPLFAHTEELDHDEFDAGRRMRGRRLFRPLEDDDDEVGSSVRRSPRRPSRGRQSPTLASDQHYTYEEVISSPTSRTGTEGTGSLVGQDDSRERARARVRQYRRRKYEEAQEEESSRRLEELQKVDRQEQSLPQVEAFRRETAKRAAAKQRRVAREREETRLAALEQEEQNRLEREETHMPKVEAFRRETARRAAARQRKEREETRLAALEQEEHNAERRERARLYATPRRRRSRDTQRRESSSQRGPPGGSRGPPPRSPVAAAEVTTSAPCATSVDVIQAPEGATSSVNQIGAGQKADEAAELVAEAVPAEELPGEVVQPAPASEVPALA